jgi:DNA-binding CsgD family transcriptional regulator
MITKSLFHRYLGTLGGVLFAALSIGEMTESIEAVGSLEKALKHPLHWIYLGFALLSLASALFLSLCFLPPALLIATTALWSSEPGSSFSGLGFAVAAFLLLLRMGFLLREPRRKALLLGSAASIAMIAPAILSGRPAVHFVSTLAGVALFWLLIWASLKGKIFAPLSPTPCRFSLKKYNLSERERQFALALIGGKSVKEMASANGLAASTVRNTLSCAYAKLGIKNAVELAVLGARFKVH